MVKRIREQVRYLYTPIIVITGSQQSSVINQVFECGASDYIAKPLSAVEVLARFRIRVEKYNLANELRQAKQLSDNANHAKSEFITCMAHELKTPLNAIYGFTQLIAVEAKNNESIMESCQIIQEAVKHQEQLINEVSNLARIEAGIIDIDLSEVDLAQIIHEAFGLTKPLAEQFKVKLHMPDSNEVKYTLTADSQKLKQVFLNLLSNAIKYNRPNGDVEIQAEKLSYGIVKISVIDTGKGISAENIPKLFEAFNRLGAEKSDIEGSGIGLPISKKIIELMDGEFGVDSTEGLGSKFWVNLRGYETTD